MRAFATIRTSVHFKGLVISVLLLCFSADVAKLTAVMTHIINFIFEGFSFHVVILADIFCISPCFSLFMISSKKTGVFRTFINSTPGRVPNSTPSGANSHANRVTFHPAEGMIMQ